jgi:predicted alpha/beta-fold hydrolase
MKPKALAKLAQFPGLFDRERLLAARDLYTFDDVFTAPLHGFRNTDDYWARGSSKPHLADPRADAGGERAQRSVHSGPQPAGAGRGRAHVTLWQPAHGGHVGFPLGPPPGHVRGMPERVGNWLQVHGGPPADASPAQPAGE